MWAILITVIICYFLFSSNPSQPAIRDYVEEDGVYLPADEDDDLEMKLLKEKDHGGGQYDGCLMKTGTNSCYLKEKS